jgi:hypothetical protein
MVVAREEVSILAAMVAEGRTSAEHRMHSLTVWLWRAEGVEVILMLSLLFLVEETVVIQLVLQERKDLVVHILVGEAALPPRGELEASFFLPVILPLMENSASVDLL